MPPSQAEAQCYERISKYPKSTKYGRQNPISARWNSEDQLVLWRAAWANVTNRFLERAGSQERVDHRSHAERGLDEQPTIHEGVVARALEQKGVVSDRCELNRQIKADNAFLWELKSLVKKLIDAAKNAVPAIAEAMETVRQKLIIFRYHLLHIGAGKKNFTSPLRVVKPDLRRYENIVRHLKDKIRERRILLDEKKAVPAIQVFRRKCHKTLHLLRCHTFGICHYYNCRSREVGKHINIHLFRGVYTSGNHKQCRQQNNQSVAQ